MLTPTEAIAIAPAISLPGRKSIPRRQVLPCRQDFPCRDPVSSGIPRSVLPDSGTHPARLPLASPGYSRPSEHTSTQKGRVSPNSSGDISISHSGVSCGHRNVPHTSDCHYTTSPDSSGLRRPPSGTLLH